MQYIRKYTNKINPFNQFVKSSNDKYSIQEIRYEVNLFVSLEINQSRFEFIVKSSIKRSPFFLSKMKNCTSFNFSRKFS